MTVHHDQPADLPPVRLDDRRLLTLAGEDRHDFLQGLVTADMDTVRDTGIAFAALLTPQGKILFDFFVIALPDRLLIDVHAAHAEALFKKLRLYKLRAQVELAWEADWAVTVTGPDTPEHPATHGPTPRGGDFADPRWDRIGYRHYGPAEDHDAPAHPGAYAAHLLDLGVPMVGAGVAPESVFLTDVNFDALNAVSYRKGCFVGQEVTSRMKRKGGVRKRTLRADGLSPDSAPGDDVLVDGTSVGQISEARDGRGLAIIRIDRLPDPVDGAVWHAEAGGQPIRLIAPDYLNDLSG